MRNGRRFRSKIVYFWYASNKLFCVRLLSHIWNAINLREQNVIRYKKKSQNWVPFLILCAPMRFCLKWFYSWNKHISNVLTCYDKRQAMLIFRQIWKPKMSNHDHCIDVFHCIIHYWEIPLYHHSNIWNHRPLDWSTKTKKVTMLWITEYFLWKSTVTRRFPLTQAP